MPESTMNVFDSKNFKSDDCKYQILMRRSRGRSDYFHLFHTVDVKSLVQECVGGSELQQRKAKIQAYSDQTSSSLKKHVYANYMQFIETAKEISRKKPYIHS